MFKQGIFLIIALAFSQFGQGLGQTCKEEGFFRNPTNCKKFYRCVDLWQNGRELTIYHFNCPVGTVFDESVSVCNWPQLAAPCTGNEDGGSEQTTPATGLVETSESVSEVDQTGGDDLESGAESQGPDSGPGESVILTPSFGFQCSAEGLFEHATDCSKFWLCNPDEDNEFESLLYICPDNYWVRKNNICVEKVT